MAGRILVGTASWTEPEFVKDWYPKGLPKSELLPWYASHFNMVEVNSTFYALPLISTVEHWVEQTPPDFVFDIKAPRTLSRHSAQINELPPDLRHLSAGEGTKAKLTPELEKALLKRLVETVEPLRSSDKLGAFILQMSPSYRPKHHKIDELDQIVEALGPFGLGIELRNRDWLTTDVKADVIAYFERQGVAFVNVDVPEDAGFMAMPRTEIVTTPSLAYLRLHGRDEKAFVHGRTVPERFDYDYSDDEIDEIAGATTRLSENAGESHIVFNNNKSSFAPKAALKLKERLK